MAPWRIGVEIGGIGFRIHGESPLEAGSELYRAFVEAGRGESPRGGPEIPIEVIAGEPEPHWLSDWVPGRMRLDTATTWALRLTGDSRWPYHLGPSPVLTSDPPQFHCLAGPRFESARVYLGTGLRRIDDRYFYPLDEVFFHHAAAFQQAVVVHASGVELEGGEGVLFLGDSGAGKSTIAELFEKEGAARRIFSDDRIVIRRQAPGGPWWMHGTPWHGTLQRTSPGGAPLRALCFIEKTSTFELGRLDPAAALPRLLPVTLGPWWLPGGPELQLGLLDELLRGPGPAFYRLGFAVEPATVSELRARIWMPR